MKLAHREVAGFDVLYRPGTDDELELIQLESDALFSGIPEYQPKAGDTIVDIGAHIGTFSLLAAQKVGKYGTVRALEPHPESFCVLSANVGLNGANTRRSISSRPRVDCLRCAVAGTEEERKLYLADVGRGHSLTYETDDFVRVSCLEMGSALGWGTALLKMNCEGAEFEIVASAPKNVLRRAENILILYHEDLATGKAVEIEEKLNEAGFWTDIRNQSPRIGRGWIFAQRVD